MLTCTKHMRRAGGQTQTSTENLLWWWYSPSPQGLRLDTCASLDLPSFICSPAHPGWLPWSHLRLHWIIVLFSVSVAQLSVVFFLVLTVLWLIVVSPSPLYRPPWTPACLSWNPFGWVRMWLRHSVDLLDRVCFFHEWSECEHVCSPGLDLPTESLDPSSPSHCTYVNIPLELHSYLVIVTESG